MDSIMKKHLLEENLQLVKEIADCEDVVSEEKFFKKLEAIKRNIDIILDNIEKIRNNK